jgi:hypothetical protein
MVVIDMQISATINFQIEQAMTAEELQHVIEKWNARGDL